MARPLADAEEVEVTTRAALRDWLAQNHGRTAGVWLVHHKKASPHYLPMADIVAECLCWGWVDSLSRGKDDLRTMHWIAPRKPGSNWSRINKGLVADLEASGAMAPPGRAVVDAAKADGSWTALDDVENLVVPADLAAALWAHHGAQAQWEAFPPSARRGILEWILNAKTATTRRKRIAETAAKAARGERANQWRPQTPPK